MNTKLKHYAPVLLLVCFGCTTTSDGNKDKIKDKNIKASQYTPSDKLDVNKVNYKYNYTVRGKTYSVLTSAKGFKESGNASWYGPGFHGKKTANGERYNMYAMTAAHKTLPLGTKVIVTNLRNKRQVTVRINDRGPFHGNRIIDLSKKAARKLGIIKSGFAPVHIKVVK